MGEGKIEMEGNYMQIFFTVDYNLKRKGRKNKDGLMMMLVRVSVVDR